MAKSNLKKIVRFFVPAAFWILIWEAASLLVGAINENLTYFIPGPIAVFKTLFVSLPTTDFLQAVGLSLLRIFLGFFVGSALGILLGILTGESNVVDMIISPALRIVRSVPVVSFIILAFIFFSDYSHLVVFISSLMVTPLVWQAVNDSIRNADKSLIEMSRVYKLSKLKKLFFVKLFSGADNIITALVSATGLAWKSGVAAEVICMPENSIGKSIVEAKNAIEYEKVFALTITIVVLSLIFETIIKHTWKKHKKTEDGRNV